jgi:hypothetical protein
LAGGIPQALKSSEQRFTRPPASPAISGASLFSLTGWLHTCGLSAFFVSVSRHLRKSGRWHVRSMESFRAGGVR